MFILHLLRSSGHFAGKVTHGDANFKFSYRLLLAVVASPSNLQACSALSYEFRVKGEPTKIVIFSILQKDSRRAINRLKFGPPLIGSQV